MQLMLRLFGIIDINALKIAEKALANARGFFDYFAGVNIDNPSKRNINTILILMTNKGRAPYLSLLE